MGVRHVRRVSHSRVRVHPFHDRPGIGVGGDQWVERLRLPAEADYGLAPTLDVLLRRERRSLRGTARGVRRRVGHRFRVVAVGTAGEANRPADETVPEHRPSVYQLLELWAVFWHVALSHAGGVQIRMKSEAERSSYGLPEIARPLGGSNCFKLDFLEREATPEPGMKLGIRLHLAVLSIWDTISILDTLGVERCRKTVHNWVQKADLQPLDSANPNHVAVIKIVIQLNDERFWLYAAVNPDTNSLLHIKLFSTGNQAITEMFLSKFRDYHL